MSGSSGSAHLYAGEEAKEAMAAGFRAPVDEERAVIAAPQRGHGPRGAERADGKSMMAEIHGRTTGACHGRGGSPRMAPRRGRHPRAPPAAGRPGSQAVGLGPHGP
ncbi:hypothetical protein [Streptomyces sp. SYP-A7185]|uniref:hypothetical protein n=1 Tax=Streptomyces sp. SYP-A7185 TaxID=3040076 RepID=UPI0038F5F343